MNNIDESVILDYKRDMIQDDDLVKHVSAFANTSGGFMVFGIDAMKKGGPPKDLPGIEVGAVSMERLEQVLLSNISPRLFVKAKNIPHEIAGRSFLVLQIPDSAF